MFKYKSQKTFFFALVTLIFIFVSFETHAKIIILIGMPGSGKGTFGQIAKSEGYGHFSIGDYIRAEITKKTPQGAKFKYLMDNGDIMKSKLIFDLIEHKINNAIATNANFVLDGFPRTQEQVEFLETTFQNKNYHDYQYIYLNIDEKTARERILNRLVCRNCKYVINTQIVSAQLLSKCSQCGGKYVKRKEDNPLAIEKRMRSLNPHTQAILGTLKSNSHFKALDSNIGVEQYSEEIRRLLHPPFASIR